METRDAGRRRGPRRHPRPLRATLSQNPPALSPLATPSCEHSPLRSPSTAPAHEALFTVSTRPYYRPTLYFGLILRHPVSYASFVPFAVPRTLARPLSRSFIAFFISRVARARYAPRVLSSRIFRLAPLTRHNASGDFYARHG